MNHAVEAVRMPAGHLVVAAIFELDQAKPPLVEFGRTVDRFGGDDVDQPLVT